MGLAGLLEGLCCLVGDTALFLFQASLGVSVVVVGFFASIAGVTDSPNLAIGVGTDLIFSKRALRWESGIQEGSGDSTAGVALPSNMLLFWRMLLDCSVSVGCSSLSAGVAWKVREGFGGPAAVVVLGPKVGLANCAEALLGESCLIGSGLLGDSDRGKARPGDALLALRPLSSSLTLRLACSHIINRITSGFGKY